MVSQMCIPGVSGVAFCSNSAKERYPTAERIAETNDPLQSSQS